MHGGRDVSYTTHVLDTYNELLHELLFTDYDYAQFNSASIIIYTATTIMLVY